MADSLARLLGDPAAFFADLVARLKPLDPSAMPVSHLCYRTATLQEYEAMREALKAHSESFVETQFNGRGVSMFSLKAPIAGAPLIELPAPKGSHAYPTGLEHVGWVAPDFGNFRKLPLFDAQQDRGKNCSPLIKTFENGKSAKFYERALKEVVQLEGWIFRKL